MFLKDRALFPPLGSQFETFRRLVDGGERLIFCNYTQSEPTAERKGVRINKCALTRIPRLPSAQTNASSGAVQQFSPGRTGENTEINTMSG